MKLQAYTSSWVSIFAQQLHRYEIMKSLSKMTTDVQLKAYKTNVCQGICNSFGICFCGDENTPWVWTSLQAKSFRKCSFLQVWSAEEGRASRFSYLGCVFVSLLALWVRTWTLQSVPDAASTRPSSSHGNAYTLGRPPPPADTSICRHLAIFVRTWSIRARYPPVNPSILHQEERWHTLAHICTQRDRTD